MCSWSNIQDVSLTYIFFIIKFNILFSFRLYPKKHPVKSIKHWASPQGKYTPYEEAVRGNYSEVKLGEKYGPT